jgi:hypothetical protein
MATFTSSLPDKLLKELSDTSKKLKLPKNKLIEKALEYYLEKLDRASFLNSYKKVADDPELLILEEEGLEDWFKILNELESE